jgi:hypothetical protein
MMKPAIPSPLTGSQPRINQAVKERLEIISGERGGRIARLPANASLADAIAALNRLLEVLQ